MSNKAALLLTVSFCLFSTELMAADYDDLPIDKTIEDEFSTSSFGAEMPQDERINLGITQDAFFSSNNKDNIRSIKWSPDVTPRIRMRFGMTTTIVLPAGERIISAVRSNPKAFRVLQEPNRKFANRIILGANYSGVDSNLTLMTESGNIYPFYLFVDPVDSPYTPDFVVYLNTAAEAEYKTFQFDDKLQPQKAEIPQEFSETIAEHARSKPDYLKSLPNTKSVNVDYKMYGEKDIAPFAAYDDGNWTYFDYRGILVSDRLPVLYKVVDGYDTVVNFRMERDFLIAESISPEGWTLKNGEKTLCIKPTVDLQKAHTVKTAPRPIFKPQDGAHSVQNAETSDNQGLMAWFKRNLRPTENSTPPYKNKRSKAPKMGNNNG